MNSNAPSLIQTLALLLQEQQPEGYARLDEGLKKLRQEFSLKTAFYLFAICPRWFARQASINRDAVSALDLFDATTAWQYPQFARLYILLELESLLESQVFEDVLNQLFDTADVNELMLLVQSLQFIPKSDRFVARAREAARSNIVSVFCALAHHSDFAYCYFDLSGWNQLILKAAFLAVPIWNIFGLKERNNPELVTMLLNYVRERQAANRVVPWDLWACVGWLAQSEESLAKLEVQFAILDKRSQGAILLSLRENENAKAKDFSSKLASIDSGFDLDQITWPSLAELIED